MNFGMPADYEELEKAGVSVKGKIVLARYGGGWRGIKPKVAWEHGAVGCLIYSDPKDDGFYQGDVFPVGPYRPEYGVQRGSVMDMPVHTGDPLTPGWGAEPGGKKLPVAEAKTILKIPVMPIAWGDAKPLLEAMRGPVAPESWRGALPTTYRLGPGPAAVRLKLAFDWQNRPLYNVIVRIDGSTLPDEWVIFGNHHDAWVNGADDPISGAVSLMEVARGLGELVKGGWKPKRTIILALWDGEEWGLLGSTEWAEKHGAGTARQGRGLHQHRRHRERLAGGWRLALAAAVHQRGGARRQRPEDRQAGARTGPPQGHRRAARGRARRGREGSEHPHRSARLGFRLHAVPAAPHRGLAQPRLRRRQPGRRLPLGLRLVRVVHRSTPTATSPTAARSPR